MCRKGCCNPRRTSLSSSQTVIKVHLPNRQKAWFCPSKNPEAMHPNYATKTVYFQQSVAMGSLTPSSSFTLGGEGDTITA